MGGRAGGCGLFTSTDSAAAAATPRPDWLPWHRLTQRRLASTAAVVAVLCSRRRPVPHIQLISARDSVLAATRSQLAGRSAAIQRSV